MLFPQLPNEKYQIIYYDPSWNYADKALAGNRGAGCKFDTMTMDELKQIPLQNIADTNCILFMWSTYPHLKDAFELIEHYGFEYKTVAFTWIKTRKNGTWFMGLGSWTRSNAEIVLLATKGKPKRIDKGIGQIVKTTYNGIHSKKPDTVRQRIIRLCGNIPRIELSARTLVSGWSVIGNDHKLQLKPLEDYNEVI